MFLPVQPVFCGVPEMSSVLSEEVEEHRGAGMEPAEFPVKCAKHPDIKMAVECPECRKEQRAAASRENGKKGGRGRKAAK